MRLPKDVPLRCGEGVRGRELCLRSREYPEFRAHEDVRVLPKGDMLLIGLADGDLLPLPLNEDDPCDPGVRRRPELDLGLTCKYRHSCP